MKVAIFVGKGLEVASFGMVVRWTNILLSFLLFIQFIKAQTERNAQFLPEARCDFKVHRDGPNGPLVTGVALDVELYYSIKCRPVKGYCLHVTNCTVNSSGSSSNSYPIIDEFGCSMETSLFGNVEYLNDFVAGIPNPYPIRFKGSSGSVQLFCATSLIPIEAGTCKRYKCIPE